MFACLVSERRIFGKRSIVPAITDALRKIDAGVADNQVGMRKSDALTSGLQIFNIYIPIMNSHRSRGGRNFQSVSYKGHCDE